MGLDISFNRTKAINAGLTFVILPNSTPESIAQEEAEPHGDPGYLACLKGSENCINVPGTDIRVADDGIDDNIAVRANKWGRVYEPLTNWLAANGIDWSEH